MLAPRMTSAEWVCCSNDAHFGVGTTVVEYAGEGALKSARASEGNSTIPRELQRALATFLTMFLLSPHRVFLPALRNTRRASVISVHPYFDFGKS